MVWFSAFYQSGMSGQSSFRLPNGEDLPLPDPRLWNNESANIDVDFANIPPPRVIRIHYRVVITAIGHSSQSRTRHISELWNEVTGYARDQGISRTVERNAAVYFGRALAQRTIGVAASITDSAILGSDNFIRLRDGDRAFTYVILR